MDGSDPAGVLLAQFHAIVTDIAERELPPFELDTPLGDLGVESLVLYEALSEVERRHGVHFGEETLARVQTLSDLLEIMAVRLEQKSASPDHKPEPSAGRG
jgi:hypothetical protein